ncbi:MAG: SH3 domain-containing protein [Anaerolineae bacterium]|nr:SH3 domain-containing protein [Anaerolineae bacterium]
MTTWLHKSLRPVIVSLLMILSGLLLAVPAAAQSQNAADFAIVDALGERDQSDLAWSPQGNLLATAGPEGVRVYEWTAEGRHLARDLVTHIPMGNVAWSSDGGLLIASKLNGDLAWLWDMTTGDLAATYQFGGVLGFMADDTLIGLGTNSGIDLWGIPGGSAITPANAYRLGYVATLSPDKPGAVNVPTRMALSPDGRWIAFATQAAHDESEYTVELWDVAGRSLLWSQDFDPDLQAGRGYTINQKILAFTPDSQQLAVHQGNAIRLLNTADGSDAALMENVPTDLSGQSMAFSPDGRILAVSTVISGSDAKLDFVLQLWDVNQGVVAGRVDDAEVLYMHLGFSADGTLLGGIFPYEPHSIALFGSGARVANLDLQLTPSPTPRPVVPTPTPTVPPVLHIGGTALIQTTGGDPLNMRGGPGRSNAIVARLPAGITVAILDGPREADGYRWWQIRTTNAVEGWVVDQVDDVQTLIPQS